jgi:prepilin-type N-terminal cleavage/methylation domain-containing protein
MRNDLGFTLIEILIVLAIGVVGMGVAVPNMSQYLERIQLKSSAQEIGRYIETARKISSRTECPTSVSLSTSSPFSIKVDLQVLLDNSMRGCVNWFKAIGKDGSSNILIRTGQVTDTDLNTNQTLQFDGITGSLNTGAGSTVILKKGSQSLTMSFVGVGNGVITYN